jgi:hypothetical protein
MEIVTPDGKSQYEKPIARLKVPLGDIRPLLGEFCAHCLQRSTGVYKELAEEADDGV